MAPVTTVRAYLVGAPIGVLLLVLAACGPGRSPDGNAVDGAHPLGQAALARALERYRFPKVGKGVRVSFSGGQPPQGPGSAWTVSFSARPVGPKVQLQLWLDGSLRTARAQWTGLLQGASELGAQTFAISPPPAWCASGASGDFSCNWEDGPVVMSCSGGPDTPVDALCPSLFVAARQGLRQIDPGGGL